MLFHHALVLDMVLDQVHRDTLTCTPYIVLRRTDLLDAVPAAAEAAYDATITWWMTTEPFKYSLLVANRSLVEWCRWNGATDMQYACYWAAVGGHFDLWDIFQRYLCIGECYMVSDHAQFCVLFLNDHVMFERMGGTKGDASWALTRVAQTERCCLACIPDVHPWNRYTKNNPEQGFMRRAFHQLRLSTS